MDATELHFHRLNTDAFIAVKPSLLTLIPQSKVAQASGGFKLVDGLPRRSQIFRIIELGLNQTPPVITLTDGKQRAAEFLLLGSWDAQVEINDYWIAMDGRQWLIGDIVRDNLYETRALVAERGR